MAVGGPGERDAGIARRRRALSGLGLDLEDLVVGEQVHGERVRRVTAADRGRGAGGPEDALPGTDGLVTAEPGVALMVLGADCPLVCLYDPRRPAVAVVHAGWKGLEACVLARAMSVLSPRGEFRVFLGPCAGPCCYEVGAEVAERFPLETVRVGGRLHLDLPAVVARQVGRMPERIGAPCSVCGTGAFSYRATGTRHRHGLIAALVRRGKA